MGKKIRHPTSVKSSDPHLAVRVSSKFSRTLAAVSPSCLITNRNQSCPKQHHCRRLRVRSGRVAVASPTAASHTKHWADTNNSHAKPTQVFAVVRVCTKPAQVFAIVRL